MSNAICDGFGERLKKTSCPTCGHMGLLASKYYDSVACEQCGGIFHLIFQLDKEGEE